ncbi:hypothetical protein F5Y04DRAFT_289367 [Hypomontagnella monticulosa]|nr:hypothetical protein F5Y04DRAFT_289367 [Hypomontagnella monticulosa]
MSQRPTVSRLSECVDPNAGDSSDQIRMSSTHSPIRPSAPGPSNSSSHARPEATSDVDSLFQGAIDLHGGGSRSRPLSFLEKLGWPCVATSCLVPLIYIAMIGLLAFLWTPTDQPRWIHFAITAWLTRSVTISTVLIGIGVDLLTGFAVSMLASLVLETGCLPLNDLAACSIMRASAPSVWNLIFSLRRTGNKLSRLGSFGLVILLTVFGITLQFSSTILISDFGPGDLPGISSTTSYKYDLYFDWKLIREVAESNGWGVFAAANTMTSYFFRSSWGLRPSVFPIFGEYHQPISIKDGVEDTGYIYRAFLPFADIEQRRNISKFRGPAYVLDSRVSCQKPNLSNLHINFDNDTDRLELKYTWFHGTISGTISNSTAIDDLWFPDARYGTNRSIPFSCQYIMPRFIGNDLMNSYHICQIQGGSMSHTFHDKHEQDVEISLRSETAGSLRSRLFNQSTRDQTPSHSPAYLIISSNWTMPKAENGAFQSVTVPVSFPAGAATNFSTQYSPSNIDARLTLCYTSWGSSNTYVELNTLKRFEEPSLVYNTSKSGVSSISLNPIITHYGVDSESADRAVITMGSPIPDSSLGYPVQQPSLTSMIGRMDNNSFTQFISTVLMWNHRNNSFDMNYTAYDWTAFEPGFTAFFSGLISDLSLDTSWDYNIIPDPVVTEFFMEAMRVSNNSPATSLSALLTLLSSDAYYDQLPLLGKPGTAEIVEFTATSYPQVWWGLSTVIILLVAHFLTCVIILALFLTKTQFTRLGNVWSVIAQVYSHETEHLIRDGTLSSDKEIQKIMEERGMAHKLMRVSLMDDKQACGPVSVGTGTVKPIAKLRVRR